MTTRLLFVTLYVWLAFGSTALGQTQFNNPQPQCTIRDISPEQAKSLTKEAQLAFQLKQASGNVNTGITYVPIRPHIMRLTNGTGGFELSKLNQAIALTNSYFLRNGSGIQFYFSGATPDYIDNDNWYGNPNSVPMDNYDVTNAMNQYYFGNGAGGYAYYPGDFLASTRSIIYAAGTDAYTSNYLIPHELGHNFNLYHTFGPNNGTAITDELVTRGAGANCSSAADLICDTPADPYGMNGVVINYVNGCPEYNPSSTARDPNGQAYSPLTNNIMSYYASTCRNSDFTAGQRQRMQEGLALRQSHTTYTLNAPPTAVTAPSNLTGTVTGLTVVLIWQDNANNEMGYFIERALGNTANFIAIGGVGPNTTTFTDNDLMLGGQYTYRIWPSNTTTGSLSQPFSVSIVPPIVDGLMASNLTGNSAQLNWNMIGASVAHDLQWRQQGSPDWNTLTNLQGGAYNLTGLLTNRAYDWRVKGSTGTVYSETASFTTTCPTPQYPITYPARTAAALYWSPAAGQQYTVEWRPQGSSNWSIIENVPTGNYQLNNLTSATPYNWRVSGTCPGTTTITTGYTPIQSFTTAACPTPSLSFNGYTSTTLQFSWYVPFTEVGRTYTLRYRPVNTANWTTQTGIVTTSYSITGLTTNLPYEVQVQSVCSPTDVAAFSPSLTAVASCQSAYSLYSQPSATTAKLEWYTNFPIEVGASFEIQYRPVGTTTWTVVPIPGLGIVGTTWFTHLLTGLSNGTTYQCRIRTICSGSSTDGSSITFTTGCFLPSSGFVSQTTSTDARLGWYANADPDARFDIQYRSVGSANWTTISSVTATRSFSSYVYGLTGLVNNTTYEWQVRTVCSGSPSNSSYVAGSQFTTVCQPPGFLNYTTRLTSIQLSWPTVALNLTYDLRFRRIGNTEWTFVDGLTEAAYSLTGLSPGTGYEGQVRTRCLDGAASAYTFLNSFYTTSCNQPQSLFTTNRTGTSALLYWYFYNGDATMNFEVRYRPINTTTWTTASVSQTGVFSSYSLAVSGLTPNTQYEWQVRSLCTSTINSGFSSSNFFNTCNTMYTLQSGFWSNPSIWSCGRVPTAGDSVEIRHDVDFAPNYTATARQVVYTPGQRMVFGANAKLILSP